MNLQQNVQTRSSINGFSRRRVDRETGARAESKMHAGRSSSSNFGNTVNGGKAGGVLTPSRDRLIYVMTHLIGLRVEVHVKNGSVISGIFHSTNAEKDFGIVLKMAQVIKDGSVKGQKMVPDIVKKPQTMIIPSRELLQVLAKDVPLTGDEFSNGHASERRKDLMIDSAISHSHHVEVERELERWIPDVDDPECPELDTTFDETWNRNWNQFETNEALFGVKSTFDEEIYTTKLDRGPQMRDLEREASRIAREIEGEETHDLHLAEERGLQFHEDFDLDEEIKYSAVHREIDDGRFEENGNSYLDTCNTIPFESTHASVIRRSDSGVSRIKSIDEAQTLSTCSSMDDEASSQVHSDKDVHLSGSSDHVITLTSENVGKKSRSVDNGSRLVEKQIKNQDDKNFLDEGTVRIASEEAQTSKSEDARHSIDAKGPSAVASSSGQENKRRSGESSEPSVPGEFSVSNEPINPSLRQGTSVSSSSERIGAVSFSNGPGLSPSSSVGSLSSEKSTLNPYAKEFKLNPNAKSFTPSASFRPQVPMSEGPFYYPNNVSAVPPMHSMPVGVGIGPSFTGHQPVYNPQAAQMQSSQAYIHPNGPLYGQQMILGQRPVYYMPTYPPEMPYKGRNF